MIDYNDGVPFTGSTLDGQLIVNGMNMGSQFDTGRRFSGMRGVLGNLLAATGAFFLNGVANSVNSQNSQNPYMNQTAGGSMGVVWLLAGVLLFKLLK